jgi:hypothetical protein
VHTKLAFLQVRRDHDNTNGQGIIPIALNGDLMEYVSFLESDDLVLKLKSTTELHDSQKLFLKVLKQRYVRDLD